MDVVHRIAIRPTAEQRITLEALGVALPPGIALPGGGEYVTFDLRESHPNWEALRGLLNRWEAGDEVRPEFSIDEISSAQWHKLVPNWHHGYPGPDHMNFGHLQATYDLGAWCDMCGQGKVQRAPFQMKGEPRWGRRGILQLHWIYDEFFVTPEVWRTVFAPPGVTCRAVMNTKESELKTVVQLVIEGAPVAISTVGLVSEVCAACRQTKYQHPARSYFPALTATPERSIVKTAEWFGSGRQADKCVLVPQVVVQAMTAIKLRGASFHSLKPEAVASDTQL